MKKIKLIMIVITAIMISNTSTSYAGAQNPQKNRSDGARSLSFAKIDNRLSTFRLATTGAKSFDQAVVKAAMAAKAKQVAESYDVVTAPVVEPHRSSTDGNWVFGGVYFPIPSDVMDTTPVTALFIAYKSADDNWEVVLKGDEKFENFVLQAPEEVISHQERELFVKRSAIVTDQQNLQNLQEIGLSLPFQRNSGVWSHWGAHGNGGTTRPYNAIDFSGGDNRVLASRSGIAYKFCTTSPTPYIEIVHDNGWTTGYYHTRNQANIVNGQQLNEGDFIGITGEELPCCGGASGNHVHWTLWRGDQNGAGEAVNGKTIGGWTWYEGSEAYQGYAERNGVRVYARSSGLVNYGYGSAWESTVDNATAGRFTASGNWALSSFSVQRYGASYAFAQPQFASDAAWFRFNIPTAGAYEIFVWYPANAGYNSATPFVIATQTGNQVVRVNQQINGGAWKSLGTFNLNGGEYETVGVSRWTSSPGYVIADAVRIVRR